MATPTAGEMLVAMLRAIEGRNLAAIGELTHPDGRFEGPYSPGGEMVTRGREAVVAMLEGVGEKMFKQVAFTIEREYPCTDPAFAVAEYRSEALLHNGADYVNRYIAVCEVRDGKIMLFREYFNPMAVIKAMNPD